MTRKHLTYALFAVTLLSLLVACGPGAPPASPTPTKEPTEAPPPTSTPEPVPFLERFEESLDPWQTGSDVPEDPENPGQPVDWHIEISPEQAAEGGSSARFTLDGKQDDGTIWLMRSFNVPPDETLRIRLTFDFWSESESANTVAKVAAYAGTEPPTEERDFDLRQPANLTAGWRTYEYTFQVNSGPAGEVWVALGISAVWETVMTYYVDDVHVDISTDDTGAPPSDDPLLLLPESAEPLHSVSVDMDGDGLPETIVLTGWGGSPDQLGYDALQMFVITSLQPGEYLIAWQSEQLPTERGESLEVMDVNGDGLPEVLSVQGMGASGETLYLLSWQDQSYGWLTPQGGYFDGWESFGEKGVRIEDVDDDGLAEILAGYGPVASQTDVYGWDGQAYVYQQTLEETGMIYERVQVEEAGLSLEVPADWTQVEPGTWTAPEDEALRLGVRWADLEPPQEPEAVLLPQPAQILDSEPVELAWGSGRRFTLEVYGEAEEGEEQAPVLAVETHVLVVIEDRAFDLYVSAPNAEQLTDLEAVLQHALDTVVIE